MPPLQSNRPSKEKGEGNKGSSSSTATFNLIKNILGAGVLSLPSGVGAFSKNPYVRTGARIPHVIDTPNHELNQSIHAKTKSLQALIPAAALTTALGSLSAYCFTLIARVCALNKVETYGEAWEKSVGCVWRLALALNHGRVRVYETMCFFGY